MVRRRFHRGVFALAGAYNLAWGVYAILDPQWLFRLAGLPLRNSPHIFAGLGMVIGLYGILYLEVARRPEQGGATSRLVVVRAHRKNTASRIHRAPCLPI